MSDLSRATERLLEVARPELYRTNAFRVLGLAVDADERVIKKQAEYVRLVEKFGDASQLKSLGPMTLKPAPTLDDINSAIHRLRTPERRLVDELFWFWPERAGQGTGDAALAALTARDLKTATETWYSRAEADEHGLASHNIAVMYHAAALDLELIPELQPLSPSRRKLQLAYWNEAFKRWCVVVKDERFWARLSGRIVELNDPRLGPGLADVLRAGLPSALLSINAQLAAAAAERGDPAEVERHTGLLSNSGFGEDAAYEAMRRAVRMLVERIRAMCAGSEAAAEAEPALAGEVTGRLIDGAGALTKAVEAVLPEGDPLPEELRDEVAASALDCLVPFGQTPGTWREALSLLERIRPLVGSSGVRERVDDVRAFLLRSAYRPEKAKDRS